MAYGRKTSILNVDDDVAGRYSVTRILTHAGFDVTEAETGNEALTLAKNLPDLILLDVNLPDINGFEVCRHLKSDPATRAIPVLHLSATYKNSKSTVNGLEGGADGYLTQPVEPRVLLAHVNTLIRSSKLEKRLAISVRSLKALLYCNQAMLHAESESDLLHEVCRVLVEVTGYRFVWVGSWEKDSGDTIRPIARWGDDDGLLELTRASPGVTGEGCCPMGEAITTRKPVLLEDIPLDSRCEPWRTEALKRGFMSAFALPLFVGGSVWGGISICSDRPGMLHEEERDLLLELPQDLSYGIESLKTREEARISQERLQDSEERFRLAFENANIGVCLVDKKGRFIRVNDQLCHIWGYSKAELDRMTVNDVTHPEDLALSQSFIDRACAGEIDRDEFEKRYIHKQGSVVWGRVTSSLVRDRQGNPLYFISHVQDVTGHKRSEETLRESETRYRYLVENIEDLICTHDLQGNLQFVSPGLAQLLGYTPLDMVGTNLRSYLAPEVKDQLDEYLGYVRRDGRASGHMRVQTRSGEKRIWECLSKLHTTPDGTEIVIGIARDITERRKAEETERRLVAAIDQATEGIIITDQAGNIQYANPGLKRITGYSSDELIGQNPRIFKSGEHDEAFYSYLWDTIKSGKIWTGRLTNRRKDGRLYYEDATISPVKDSSGKVINFVAVKRDITEHLDLTKQLQQAQKMEAIGTLAGGVAHDFNNILQVAIGYSELMLGEDALPDNYRSDLKKIYESARRGAELVKRLLSFSRKTEMTFQPVNLNQRIIDLRKMLERTLPKMIDIELRLEKDLDRINADPTQMDQVLMNLAVNARDAMPDGGKLSIETAGGTIDAQDVKTHLGLNPGRYVLLSVTDTGSGIDKDSLEKIFEPFFTTKGLGEGTGLGLAMVHGIVKQHSGHISCYSEPGAGTTFKIYLPAIEREVETDIDTTGTMPDFGTETILLVDDEEFFRDLGARILTNQGYSVIHAVNGKEALELFKKERARIDLVILDLIMPLTFRTSLGPFLCFFLLERPGVAAKWVKKGVRRYFEDMQVPELQFVQRLRKALFQR